MKKYIVILLVIMGFNTVCQCFDNTNDQKIEYLDKVTRYCSSFIYPHLKELAEKEFSKENYTDERKKMLSLPKSFFYTAKSEQVNKEIKEYFKNKNPTKDAINSYIINRYKLTFSDLEDNIFVELGQDLKKNF